MHQLLFFCFPESKNKKGPIKPFAFSLLFGLLLLHAGCQSVSPNSSPDPVPGPDALFRYNENISPRWVSFENSTGAKGQGGQENRGAKGHPYDRIDAGQSVVLAEVEGPGIINRMWITIRDRGPQMMRGLVLNIYWDGAEKPAVSAPIGDFFGQGLGRMSTFENSLFANPEGRSFNCFIPMPFQKKAKIELINETDQDLTMIFYDVNLQLLNEWSEEYLYFHTFWHRDTATQLAKDFEIMPKVQGRGRFLGTNVSVHANPIYNQSWWGEGEVKVFLNGDDTYPTLVGTGAEDYIGTAWGQGQYANQYTGCLIADTEKQQWSFYRFHIPDPIFFQTDCRITLQQMGGNMKPVVAELQQNGVELIPVSIQNDSVFRPLYESEAVVMVKDLELQNSWVNFFRSDDVAAAAYFYLDSPTNDLPGIQPLAERIWKL